MSRVAVLGAHSSWRAIVEQARQFRPETVVLADPKAAALARTCRLDTPATVESSKGAVIHSSH